MLICDKRRPRAGGLGVVHPQVAKRNGCFSSLRSPLHLTREPCRQQTAGRPSRLRTTAVSALPGRTVRQIAEQLSAIQRTARVTHTCPHAHAHAVNDRTDMPRRGQLVLLAARPPHRPCRWQDQRGRGFQTLRRFQFRQGTGAPPGAAPPGPKGQRGHMWLSRRSRQRPPKNLSTRGLRSFRGKRPESHASASVTYHQL